MKIRNMPWGNSIQLWGTEEFAKTYKRVWFPQGPPADEVFRVEYLMIMQAGATDGGEARQGRAPGSDIGDVEGPASNTPWDPLFTGDDAEGTCEGPDAEEGPWFTAEELRAFTEAVLKHGGPYLDPLPLIPTWSVFASSLRAEAHMFVHECYPGWARVSSRVDTLAANESGCVFSVSGVVCRDLSNGLRVEQSFCFLCFTGLPLWLKDVECTGPDDVWGAGFDQGRRPGIGND